MWDGCRDGMGAGAACLIREESEGDGEAGCGRTISAARESGVANLGASNRSLCTRHLGNKNKNTNAPIGLSRLWCGDEKSKGRGKTRRRHRNGVLKVRASPRRSSSSSGRCPAEGGRRPQTSSSASSSLLSRLGITGSWPSLVMPWSLS